MTFSVKIGSLRNAETGLSQSFTLKLALSHIYTRQWDLSSGTIKDYFNRLIGITASVSHWLPIKSMMYKIRKTETKKKKKKTVTTLMPLENFAIFYLILAIIPI